jgi:Na+/H+-dicarboxylate symporter
MRRIKKIPSYVWILLGMLLGVAWGMLAININMQEFTLDWVSPFGTIFINLLKLIAIPLILVSLIKGVSDLKDMSSLSSMGFRTLGLYLVTTVIAITVGLVLVNLINPGQYFPKEKTAEYSKIYHEQVSEKEASAEELKDDGPLQFLVDIVPENAFGAAANNANMLQVIFISLLLGIAMILIPEKKVAPFKAFVDSLNDVVLKVIDIIMRFAPIGVFALLADVIVNVVGTNSGDSAALFSALGMYALVVVVGLLSMVFIIYPAFIVFLTRIKYLKFLRGIFPAQLLAFSTSSSAATLPVTKRCVENNLGVDKEVSSFVLPIGATINMDGTSLYQAVAAVFIAQAYGLDLSFVQQLTIVLTATLASIGSAAVPGAGMVMLVIVLSSVHLPIEGIALIFAVDRPLDMLRTTVNITGDSAVASIVNIFRKPKKAKPPTGGK